MNGQPIRQHSSSAACGMFGALTKPSCKPALFTALAAMAITFILWLVTVFSGPSDGEPAAYSPTGLVLAVGLLISALAAALVHLVLALRLQAGAPAEAREEREGRFEDRIRELTAANRELESRLEKGAESEGALAEKRRTDEDLLHLAAVVEQLSEGVIVFDKYRLIRYVNPALESITGYTRPELIGSTTDLLGVRMDGDGLADSVWHTADVEGCWRGRTKAKKKDGAVIETDAFVSPIRDASGQVSNYVSVCRDVTHEVHLELQLRQAQKAEALGTLAGGIAHDFNNILGAIIAFTELAQDGLPDGDPTRQDLEEVLKAGLRGKSLIKQILTFSRPGAQERRSVELGTIVNEALRLIRASLPSTIEIRQDFSAAPPGRDVIVADPTEVHQVLVNLCSNASHAMREGNGILDVVGECVEIDAGMPVEHPDLLPGAYLRLSVRDTGHGMTREVMERIFDPYFTTKKSGEGTGLGLSVAQGIVKSHGGVIAVSSIPGEGTSFHIYFPKGDTLTAEEDRSIDPLPTGSERILFIDDEDALALAGQRILEHLGYEVVTCTSGMEALEKFREDPLRFDLVISDQTMPQTTGIDLASKLLRMRPALPIILYTGFGGDATEDEAKEIGIREFLMKPVTTRRLAEAVRSVLDGAAG